MQGGLGRGRGGSVIRLLDRGPVNNRREQPTDVLWIDLGVPNRSGITGHLLAYLLQFISQIVTVWSRPKLSIIKLLPLIKPGIPYRSRKFKGQFQDWIPDQLIDVLWNIIMPWRWLQHLHHILRIKLGPHRIYIRWHYVDLLFYKPNSSLREVCYWLRMWLIFA